MKILTVTTSYYYFSHSASSLPVLPRPLFNPPQNRSLRLFIQLLVIRDTFSRPIVAIVAMVAVVGLVAIRLPCPHMTEPTGNYASLIHFILQLEYSPLGREKERGREGDLMRSGDGGSWVIAKFPQMANGANIAPNGSLLMHGEFV